MTPHVVIVWHLKTVILPRRNDMFAKRSDSRAGESTVCNFGIWLFQNVYFTWAKLRVYQKLWFPSKRKQHF